MEPHDVLGLSPDARDYEIRRRYLDLAAELRPRERPADRDRLQELNRAYQALQTGDGVPKPGVPPSGPTARPGDRIDRSQPTTTNDLPPVPTGPDFSEPPFGSAPDPGYPTNAPMGGEQPPVEWSTPGSAPTGGGSYASPGPGTAPIGTGGPNWAALGGPMLKVAAVIVGLLLFRYVGFFGLFIVFGMMRWFGPMVRNQRR